MKQALHIFRKDVRHLWPELAVSGLLLAIFCVVTPQTWAGAEAASVYVGVVSALVKILLPAIWLVMIARVVHEENLVGDQQFWVTRPYHWGSLLAAKVLFLVVCIAVPFGAAQALLLRLAGLHPVQVLPIQLWELGHAGLILWLTFLVVSSVTVNLSRAFLSMVAVAILWAALLTISFGRLGSRMSMPFGGLAVAVVCGGMMVATLLYQYATRDTKRSRMTLGAMVVAFFVLLAIWNGVFLSGLTNMLVRQQYPVTKSLPLQLVLQPTSDEPKTERRHASEETGRWVSVTLPALVKGMPEQDRLHDTSASFTVDAPGYHYESPWRNAVPDEDGLKLTFPREVLERVESSPVRLHVSLIGELLTPGTPQVFAATDQFDIPGIGVCMLLENEPGNNLACRHAFNPPLPTRVMGMVATGNCLKPISVKIAGASIPPRGSGGIDPVAESMLPLGGSVCPGTRLTFVTYHSAGNLRVELDVPAIKLGEYEGS